MIALSEAWSAGLIPIVTDLGAQSERVTDGVDGFKVPPHDPASIAICLRRIQSGDIKRDKICAAIAAKAASLRLRLSLLPAARGWRSQIHVLLPGL